ncbi:MAG: EF-P lysine aminoacylase EpmA [Halieaceae bacterium]|jgi:lysyl-tRNA synthetase class 2|nr:EF-P lysine aminoacylase EpmA [Halieaceae bacterium]
MLNTLRAFFNARGVLEVETPLLCSSTITDPAIQPLAGGERWLQTSPEYAMKRLLAAGSGPIYQVCKAFRDGEAGARHNPEFTLLEWYRPGFSLAQLMQEVAELVAGVLGEAPVEVLSYRDLFQRSLGIDPLTASSEELEQLARERLDYGGGEETRDTWLDLLLTHLVEPTLSGRVFVHDYPASQAALARLRREGGATVAERFELYVDGVELANGYFELADPAEQRSRFEADNEVLTARGEPPRPLDEDLLAAVQAGLPDCSGVALGLDRLLMLKLGAERLEQVLSFDWSRC